MVKKQFKKSYANTSSTGYSKEYMDAYMAWYSQLSKKQKLSLQECNNFIKGKNKKERNRNKRQTKNYYGRFKNPMP